MSDVEKFKNIGEITKSIVLRIYSAEENAHITKLCFIKNDIIQFETMCLKYRVKILFMLMLNRIKGKQA